MKDHWTTDGNKIYIWSKFESDLSQVFHFRGEEAWYMLIREVNAMKYAKPADALVINVVFCM